MSILFHSHILFLFFVVYCFKGDFSSNHTLKDYENRFKRYNLNATLVNNWYKGASKKFCEWYQKKNTNFNQSQSNLYATVFDNIRKTAENGQQMLYFESIEACLLIFNS